MKNKNAIILAAGKSNRFAPFTYEKPKGLFIVKGEVLIERQIKQLIEAGIKEIIVVIGYMKEKFFYLEQKYPEVKLVVNNTFGKYGNIYSIYVARNYLQNTYICCADHYFVNNPFLDNNVDNISYRAGTYYSRKFREFSIDYTDANVISGCYIGGSDKMAMVGHAYFNEGFSSKFVELMEDEINNFGIANMFWEEFYQRHIKDLTLYVKEFAPNEVLEFDDIDELRKFDSDFLLNVDSEIVDNICSKLNCHPNEITNISVIQAGLTNVSFKFTVNRIEYVYRHPGGTAGNLIDRRTEITAQMAAKSIDIDKSVIYMDPTGWKLSYYVQDIVKCDFLNNKEQLEKGMDYLRKIHSLNIDGYAKEFDDVEEGKKLMLIASSTKGNLCIEFKNIVNKIDKLKISKLNKDNYILSKEDKDSFIDFINQVDNTSREYDKIQTLSNTLVNAHEQLKDKNNKIKTLTENNEALNLRVKALNNTIKEKDNEISFLKSKISDLKNTLEYWKNKFSKLISFLHDKLHSWYDKDDKYIDVVNEMYGDNVLDDDDIDDLDLNKEKDDFER